MHGPIQAPDNYTALYDAEIYHPRLMCLAMIAAVDESIGKVTAALQSRGLWSDTLIIFSSDNVCTPLFCQPLFQLASNSASLVL
eukprot:COSAG01_NODE_26_length_36857_cov_31.426166_25_plen_84_part_00